MLMPILLMSLAATGADVSDRDARCSYLVRFSGPDPQTMYVHAVATGERRRVATDPDPPRWLGFRTPGNAEALPDTVVAFEFRVERVAGGEAELSRGDLILVTPWGYRPDCSPVRWRDEWIGPGEETLLTLADGSLLTAAQGREIGETLHFDIQGYHHAYPQGSWHEARGQLRSMSGPPWMSAGEFFDLLRVLPSAEHHEVWFPRDHHQRVVELMEAGPECLGAHVSRFMDPRGRSPDDGPAPASIGQVPVGLAPR